MEVPFVPVSWEQHPDWRTSLKMRAIGSEKPMSSVDHLGVLKRGKTCGGNTWQGMWGQEIKKNKTDGMFVWVEDEEVEREIKQMT